MFLAHISAFIHLVLEFSRATQTQSTLINLSTPTQNWFLTFIHDTNIFFPDTESGNNYSTDIEYMKCTTYYPTCLTYNMYIYIMLLIIPLLHVSDKEAMNFAYVFSSGSTV